MECRYCKDKMKEHKKSIIDNVSDFECMNCGTKVINGIWYDINGEEYKEKPIAGHSEMKKLPYIVCVDFDGTLVEDKFPHIGEPNTVLINRIKALQRNSNIKFILWTCRNNLTPERTLDKAIEYLATVHGLVFNAHNENIEEVQTMFGHDTRKVYGNEYWDDKNNQFLAPDNWKSPGFKPTYRKGDFR